MTSERELKLPVSDRAELRAALAEAGAELLHSESFEDNVLWDKDGALRAAHSLLRLRTDGQGARLTFKGPATFEDGVKVRQELETGVESDEALASILAALGYSPVRRYQKYREEWRLDDVVIALDRTPIGNFVEFEGAAARAAAERCGCDPEAALESDYLALYDAHRERHPRAPADMIFAAPNETGDG